MAEKAPKILAIETSTASCSVALRSNGVMLNRQQAGSNIHSQIVLQQIESLLEEVAWSVDELDAVAVGNGPGSFTGLRIGVGVGQGLAYGAQCAMVAVSSLAALALNASGDGRVVAAIDARMGEIYFAIYEKRAEQLKLVAAPNVVPPCELIVGEFDLLVGNAWSEYWSQLPSEVQSLCDCPDPSFPTANHVVALAERGFEQGEFIDPISFSPVYVRNDVAKKKAEQGK